MSRWRSRHFRSTNGSRSFWSTCKGCRLADVRRVLAADAPGSLPPEVAGRLDAALAGARAEAEARAEGAPETVTAGRSRWLRPALALAAGVVVLAAAAGGLARLGAGHG